MVCPPLTLAPVRRVARPAPARGVRLPRPSRRRRRARVAGDAQGSRRRDAGGGPAETTGHGDAGPAAGTATQADGTLSHAERPGISAGRDVGRPGKPAPPADAGGRRRSDQRPGVARPWCRPGTALASTPARATSGRLVGEQAGQRSGPVRPADGPSTRSSSMARRRSPRSPCAAWARSGSQPVVDRPHAGRRRRPGSARPCGRRCWPAGRSSRWCAGRRGAPASSSSVK